LRLFLSNKRLLGFGMMLTFFSGFGKTFMISLYIPDFLKEFQLSNTLFSTLYAIATIGGGFMIIYLGRMIDRMRLKTYAILVTFGLIGSAVIIAFTHEVFFLLVGLLGLRLTGQGLMNHTSMTAMSKYFKRCRGKAISISTMGHSIGEGILPLITATTIAIFGWRNSLGFSAIFMALILVPLTLSLLNKKPKACEEGLESKKKRNKVKEDWTVSRILKDDAFYLMAPNFFIMPFIFTGLMFFMIPLGAYKGWTIEWMAYCFIGFAISNFFSAMITGHFIDKIKAIKLFPFYLLPMIIAISIVIFFSAQWAGMAYLILLGISVGMAVTTESNVITEVYGIRNLGTVRSVFSFLAITGSALGPLCMSILRDFGLRFESVLEISLILLAIISVNSLRKFPKKHHSIQTIWEIPKVMIFRKAS
ncbi:MAG TPA: MFS transporter, partial [Cytophagaceae bacterium]|nr:MFS transporter [Cytophagaceae bacterium]